MQVQAFPAGFSDTKPVAKPTLNQTKRKKIRSKKSDNRNKCTKVNIFSNNCNGANLKIECVKYELKKTQSTIFTLQETHFSKKGRVKIEDFIIFEAIRIK